MSKMQEGLPAGAMNKTNMPSYVPVTGQSPAGDEAVVAGRMSHRLITDADMLGGMSFELSGAQSKVAAGVLDKFRCVADVGCDHGYVSIYLVQKGIAQTPLAMDVRKGPLSMAESNISDYGLSDKIRVRLSDGLSELEKGEADALVIAGMGGKLMISILEKKDLRELGIRVAVLQPQSDIHEFRQYLRYKGYVTVDERVVFEDGKYYFPMRVLIAEARQSETKGTKDGHDDLPGAKPFAADGLNIVRKLFSAMEDETVLRICNRYGEHNIARRDPVLKDYLVHGKEVALSILKSLDESAHGERVEALRQELSDIEAVLALFE